MTTPISIQTPNVQRPSIELVFDQSDDRWEHQWILNNGPSGRVILKSIEGTPDQAWPSSPPLQDINLHSFDQGDAVLGVGMAGKSHWSASYSVERKNGPVPRDSIKSDLACLQKGVSPDSMIGSVYEIDPSCDIHSVTEQRLELLIFEDQSMVFQAFSDRSCQTTLEVNGRTLTIRPAVISNQPSVATRWGFEVSIELPS